ncbi:flagellar basal-body MS-ring/collar protein FliF [Ruegeria hyattellae]|uniref:flagellar basal-body MS-ring/collar protein FliF n=1 Tax=Ruegeria hyattellae TaxID=3233337 RepID=UPI00355C65B4
MQQIGSVWAGLNKRKQILAIAAIVAMAVTIFGLVRISITPSMALLYADLETGAAGEVVRALEQEGVPYEVKAGAIYVASDRRDQLRLTLASEGLPANGGRGYELLDSLNGFGTTSRMFDAAYWRAKEGELARTLVAGPHVAQARVHIANNMGEPFRRDAKTTASVFITSANAKVQLGQADAIRYLVASAVNGLNVDDVAVIDAAGGLIGEVETASQSDASDARADRLRERVLRLIEARVGRGNAVVEVSVDTVTKQESVRERRFDPSGRVAISTDLEERSDSASNQSNDVTVASNLPDGDAGGEDSSKSLANSTRERVNYEVSETETEILRLPGAIKRLSVAVLVNETVTTGADGALTSAPRPENELEAMRELVASAVGFDTERGDVITIKSMQLPVPAPEGTEAVAPSFLQGLGLRTMPLIQMAFLTLVLLGLGAFVIRPILTSSAASSLPQLALSPEPGASDTADLPALSGEVHAADAPPGTAQAALEPAQGQAVSALPTQADKPVDRLRELVGDRQDESVEILRSWLEESRGNA